MYRRTGQPERSLARFAQLSEVERTLAFYQVVNLAHRHNIRRAKDTPAGQGGRSELLADRQAEDPGATLFGQVVEDRRLEMRLHG